MTFRPYIPALLLCSAASAAAAATLFEDDFESGTLVTTQSPPGKWRQEIGNSRGNTTETSPFAAHRGARGLRIIDRDTGDGGPPAGQAGVTVSFNTPFEDRFHIRVWARIVPQTTPAGRSLLFDLGTPGSPLIAFIALTYPGAGLEFAGDSADGLQAVVERNLIDGRWHLWEIGVTGLGTRAGTRTFWIDGVLAARHEDLNFVGEDPTVWRLGRLSIGEPYSYVLPYTGTHDFDDLRLTLDPSPSRVDLVAPEPLVAGTCNRLRALLLQSADGGLAGTPEDVPLRFSTDAGTVHASAACDAGQAIEIATGAAQADVFFVPARTGTLTLTAGTAGDDLLPGTRSFTAFELAAHIDGPQSAQVLESVTLDGSGSRAMPGRTVRAFRWRQLQGPGPVELSTTATLTFTPQEPGEYGFELVVSDGAVDSAPARAWLTVEGDRERPPERIGGCYCGAGGAPPLVAAALLVVLARSLRSRRPSGRRGRSLR